VNQGQKRYCKEEEIGTQISINEDLNLVAKCTSTPLGLS
jgi:hypothetical protein